jgi:type I restriction enzyme S subunit
MTGDIAFLPMDAIGDDGEYARDSVRLASDVESGYTYLKQGDVIRARVTPCFENRKGAWLSTLTGGEGLGTTELFVFKPSDRINPRFLYYVTMSDDFVNRGTATMYGAHGVRRVDEQFARNYELWVPPVAVQSGIAGYLDGETTRIDELVAAKRRMVELLTERDRADLSHLMFPDNADFAHLRHFATVQGGVTVDSTRDVGPDAVTRPYLRVANVQAGILDLSDVTEITVPPEIAKRSTLRPNDVLMTEGGDIDKLGRGTVWEGQLEGCLHQNHIFAVRPNPRYLDSWYLAFITQSSQARSYFESTGVQSTNLASTSSSKILGLRVPVLPLRTQREVVERWKVKVARTRKMNIALERQMKLLKERRQALITAAVTGQLDIQEAA